MQLILRRDQIQALTTLIITVALIACQQAQRQPIDAVWTKFNCEDGSLLQLQFDHEQQVALMMYQGRRYTLHQMRTASGFGYQDDFWLLQGKGTSLLLQSPNTNTLHCDAY